MTARIVACTAVAAAMMAPVARARADDSACASLRAAAPGRAMAWRAEVEARTAVFDGLPGGTTGPSRRLSPNDAPALLILARPRVSGARCWLRVRLPWRPNRASGWVDAAKVAVERTPWRIEVSRQRRTLTLYKHGARAGSVRVVLGKPDTPTPAGLFAVTWAIRWHPSDFLGSWVLELTAHSTVLQRFDGGDGTVGIHGRGGASLMDPLGSARSHGCVRLSNRAIDWLVRRVGPQRLPGTPVEIR